MTLLVTLPILIPLSTAAVSLAVWRWRRIQRVLTMLGAVALFVVSLLLFASVHRDGIQAVQIGAWPAPYGITLIADLFSAIMVALSALVGLATIVYSLASMDLRREAFGYYPLVLILMAGITGSFLTGDIFNLFVWFEVMLIASFVLLALGGEKPQLEGAIKYVTLNLLSSALFLTAVGIIYGLVGTLNMADLHVKLPSTSAGLGNAVAMLFFVAFGLKAAVFPLFFWLPASYHTPPAAVSAIFAGLLTKVGVYALIRVFTLLFLRDDYFTYMLLLWLSGLTMITGVLGAVAQNQFRRILAFHSISQIGYMLMGLALFGLAPSVPLANLALASAIVFMLHHGLVKMNLFLISGAAAWLKGSYELKCLGGLYRACPGLSLAFLITALSLAGLPPLSGFFAKLSLIQTALGSAHYVIAGVALAVGILTLYSMIKIWSEAFLKPDPQGHEVRFETLSRGARIDYRGMLVPIIALTVLAVAMGVAAEPVFSVALEAAEQLRDPAAYLQAVRGATP